ncbi:hypothetical protein [Paenibacillus sp. MMS18-CY102]|uniref:hypothetical protein n=1 Tax=Paenibacillus sp. MMS18-CY102 TaxID=2682849 RepID=UPI00136573D4|nr:hypothetical protein [Paenibacillus sp. MMS18-CY102]MWC26818.1 hypothetical protein [Paenibacillus sp. MMS18-CY102]
MSIRVDCGVVRRIEGGAACGAVGSMQCHRQHAMPSAACDAVGGTRFVGSCSSVLIAVRTMEST